MPGTLSGDATLWDVTMPISASVPVAGDDLDAAEPLAFLTQLFNAMERVRLKGGFIDVARTWLALQTLQGANGDANPAVAIGDSAASVTVRKLAAILKLTGTGAAATGVYVYIDKADGSVGIVGGATWLPSGPKWTLNTAGSGAIRLKIDITNGHIGVSVKSPGAADWFDNAWDAEGAYGAGGLLLSGTGQLGKLLLQQTISSAAVGAGQAVNPGEAFQDTLSVAWGRFSVNHAGVSCTLIRGANIASVQYIGNGVYDVTLQVAASHVLSPTVTAIDNQAGSVVIDSGVGGGFAPTTSKFRILYFAGGVASDPNGTTGGFTFDVKGG